MERFTADQRAAIEAIADWFKNERTKQITVGGLAGTGKTTIAAHLPRALGLRDEEVAYCAYTGKAAEVLRKKLDGYEAGTIHQLIYKLVHESRCISNLDWDADCNCSPTYRKTPALHWGLRLIIVDEASMVDEDIYRDLRSFGVRIIWIGDHGQLPPIGGSFNLMDQPDVRLEQIHRQEEGSPILELAFAARTGRAVHPGCYGPGHHEIDTEDVGTETAFLCHTNEIRVRVNSHIRRERGFPADRPVVGDRVICLRNNHKKAIVNGTTGTLSRIRDAGDELLVEVALDGNAGDYRGIVSKEQFGIPKRLNPPRSIDLWDYAYCLTVHKAQGSEYQRVVLIDGYRRADRARWLYTAITRAKRQLRIVTAAMIESW